MQTQAPTTEMTKELKLPVASSLMGLGAFPASHQQALGMLGMHGTYEANMTMHNSDVIFAVGVRFDDRTTNNLARYCPNATVLHIDIDPTSISKTVPADVPIVGDARLVLEQMLELLEQEEAQQPLDDIRDWWQQIEQWRARHCLRYDDQSDKIKPQAVIETIWRLTQGDAYVTSDVGQHQMWAAQFFDVYRPRHFLTSGGQGTMGYGLPAALGAKIGRPDSSVVLFTGDGSIMMNCQEFATIADNNIDVKVVIIHNCILGMVGQWQRLFYNHHYSQSELKGKTDFVKLAEAFGIRGYCLTKQDELETRLPAIMRQAGPAVIDVWIPEDEDVLPMVPGGKRLDQMVLGGGKR